MAELNLQKDAILSALDRLEHGLKRLRGPHKAFLQHYRTTRQAAFEVEFLAKLYRKCRQKKLFEDIADSTKLLEDRLGRFNETDELVHLCEATSLNMPGGVSGATHFTKLRDQAQIALRRWMDKDGWSDGRELKRMRKLLQQAEWLDNVGFREFCRERVTKTLLNLHEDIDSGVYDPRAKGRYRVEEVEPKIHELRREIRKLSQYMAYVNGVFAFSANTRGLNASERKVLKHFTPLLDMPLADSPYARLPKARVEHPVLVPQCLFLAITCYVDVLGKAKDWALNLHQLTEAGISGHIDLEHLDPRLTDYLGVPRPFNHLVLDILAEIRDTRLFAVMARLMEAR